MCVGETRAMSQAFATVYAPAGTWRRAYRGDPPSSRRQRHVHDRWPPVGRRRVLAHQLVHLVGELVADRQPSALARSKLIG